MSWTSFQGAQGSGRAVPLTTDSGYFWFFNKENVEIVVKTLDARSVNGHFWVFFGSLTNVEFDLEVTDTATGLSKTYHNPSGSFASQGDTSAFPDSSGTTSPAAELKTSVALPLPAKGACVPTGEDLCLLDGRFRLAMTWRGFSGNAGDGFAVPLTTDSGYFWFFNRQNVEIVVKTLDATSINGHFWVFYGALTNVEFELTVTDTATGEVKVYRNPSGVFASVGDTAAF